MYVPASAGEDSSSSSSRKQRLAIVPALEEVFVWDVKKGERLGRWRDEADEKKARVACIKQNPQQPQIYAVGYADGVVRLWNAKMEEMVVAFNGHRSEVVALEFDVTGTRLASCSRDGSVIIWDVVAEVGLARLKGHTGPVQQIAFVVEEEEQEQQQLLLSCGVDGLLMVWDLNTSHCIETHVAHRGQTTSLAVDMSREICLTTGSDGDIKVWQIALENVDSAMRSDGKQILTERGTLKRQLTDSPVFLQFHPSANYLACLGSERAVEIFKYRSDAELKKLAVRKRQRQREKGKEGDEVVGFQVADLLMSFTVVRSISRIKSICWLQKAATSAGHKLELLLSTQANTLETYSVFTATATSTNNVDNYALDATLDSPGHRSDVRAVAISSDNKLIASAAQGSVKIWSSHAAACLRTFECAYPVCCAFAPGDRYLIVGTRSGSLELFDLTSSTLVCSVPQAHSDTIWSVHVSPDRELVITGSKDKSVKTWKLNSTHPEDLLKQVKVLKLPDEVLCARFTPSQSHIAVALLDSTIKVFYSDTLKFFLSLYGHKLPVLSMDISSDSKLLVSCSADKNVKIWGLDFGDCHKSLFAHTDSIMQVVFERAGEDDHNFFTCSKDGLIKYWDGDKFEQISKYDAHHGEVWALAMSPGGDFFVSGSHDRSIRIWDRTEEQVFLEEEREKELDELYEQNLVDELKSNGMDDANSTVVSAVGKQTIETLKAGERLIEALELGFEDYTLAEEHAEALKQGKHPGSLQRNPVLLAKGGISAEQHVLDVVNGIRPSELEDALLVLPFDQVTVLLTFLNIWASKVRFLFTLL